MISSSPNEAEEFEVVVICPQGSLSIKSENRELVRWLVLKLFGAGATEVPDLSELSKLD